MGQEGCVVPRPARWADDFVLDEEEVAKKSKLRRGSSEGSGIGVSKDRAVKAAAAHKGKANQGEAEAAREKRELAAMARRRKVSCRRGLSGRFDQCS